MATQIPKPKRRRLDKAESTPLPYQTIIVQFVQDGTVLGPPVSLPTDTERSGLEVLVNSLRGSGEDPLPFSFQVSLSDAASTRLPVHSSLSVALKEHANVISTEDVLVIECQPEAIFRVREVTRCSSSLMGHDAPILCAAFSPTGTFLATGSGDNTCRTWNLDSETPQFTLFGHVGWLLCIEWDGLERFIATGSHDRTIRLWDARHGRQIGEALRGHGQWITSLAWEPIHINASRPRLASASKDSTVRIWDAQSRRADFILGGHSASVNVVRWGGDGIIYTASSDQTVKMWDAVDGKLIRSLKNHAHWVNSLSLNTDYILRTGPFDHTGLKPVNEADAKAKAASRYEAFIAKMPPRFITGSDDHTLYLWTPSQKQPLARLTGHQKQVNHVAFSPDGRFIASAGFDNAVKLWEGQSGRFITSLRGHVAAVYRVSFSPDSRLLVSASKDSTLKLWSLKTGKLAVDLPGHTDEVYCVDFVADRVASGGREGMLKLWRH